MVPAAAQSHSRLPRSLDTSPTRAAAGAGSAETPRKSREGGWLAAAAWATGAASPERVGVAHSPALAQNPKPQSPAPLSAPPVSPTRAIRLSASWRLQRSGESLAAEGPGDVARTAGGLSGDGGAAGQHVSQSPAHHVQSRSTSARSSIQRLSFARDAEPGCLPDALHTAAFLRSAADGRASGGARYRLCGAVAAQDSPISAMETTRRVLKRYSFAESLKS